MTPEVTPFGIRTMVVEPGIFRTDLLTPESTDFVEPTIDDYAETSRQTIAAWTGTNGKQGGDPAKLGTALVQLAGLDEPPLRWVAGVDPVQGLQDKANLLLTQIAAHRDLSSALDHQDLAGDITGSPTAGRLAADQ